MVFYLDAHYFVDKGDQGTKPNNQVKLTALFQAMKLTLELGIVYIQVFKDLLITIRWMKGGVRVQFIVLQHSTFQLGDINVHFQEMSFSRMYRQHNVVADSHSKHVIFLMQKNYMQMIFKPGSLISHRTYACHMAFAYNLCIFCACMVLMMVFISSCIL